jgi:hypothetical protein
VAVLEAVFIGAFWVGFALLGLALVTWLLDWGHLLSHTARPRRSRWIVRLAVVSGVLLVIAGVVGALLRVGG